MNKNEKAIAALRKIRQDIDGLFPRNTHTEKFALIEESLTAPEPVVDVEALKRDARTMRSVYKPDSIHHAEIIADRERLIDAINQSGYLKTPAEGQLTPSFAEQLTTMDRPQVAISPLRVEPSVTYDEFKKAVTTPCDRHIYGNMAAWPRKCMNCGVDEFEGEVVPGLRGIAENVRKQLDAKPSPAPVAIEKVREALDELGNHDHFDHTMQHGAGCKTCIRQRELRKEALALLDQQCAHPCAYNKDEQCGGSVREKGQICGDCYSQYGDGS